MWVNSKVAAEILGVEYEKLKKATQRANKAGKNFCSLGCHKCHFTYTDGIGRGGKVLQIWIEDQIICEKGVKNGAYDNSANVCGSGDRYATLSKNLSGTNESACSSNTDNGAVWSENQSQHASSSDHMHDCGDNSSNKSDECVDKAQILAYAAQYGVRTAAKFYGVNEKSLYRWKKEYARSGAKALKDKRGAKSRANTALIKQAILAIGTAQMTSWWMEYCRVWAVINKKPFDMFGELKADISRATFLRHASEISKNDYEVRAFLRGGRDTLDTNISIKRNYLAINEEWQIDATPFDFMCLDEVGEPKRYTAVGIVDVGSGRRVYELCDSPNSYANVRLLKKAFSTMGRPGYIKGDNGKDYVGEHFQGVLKRLGVVYVKAAKFDGRGKGKIERSHKIVQDFFESLPGFLGHNVGQRSAREAQAEDKSARLSGVKTNIKNLISRDAMQGLIDKWCASYKSQTNVATWEFDERVFGKAYARRLQAEGFSIDGLKFVSLEVFRHAKLGDVCELIQNIDDASVWHVYKEGEYKCDVINSQVVSYTAEEVKAARKEYARRVINPTKAYIRSLQNEKDAYYKAVAQSGLKEKMAAKSSVIKKSDDEVVSQIKIRAKIANKSVYMPDLEDALKVLNG
ncbi:MAG: helix-turn-helix domain-containing protein [Campylobacter hyointestinalis]